MVAAKDVVSTDWEPMLDRLRDHLAKAARSKMYGDLTLTVAFMNGEPTTETIGVVHRRKLKNP
jgi:hypothetical protein